LLSPHPLLSGLGASDETRQSAHRGLFNEHMEGPLLNYIRQAENKGVVLGSKRFVEVVEALIGKKLKEGNRGMPVRWRKESKPC
jgi:hypothetical protein